MKSISFPDIFNGNSTAVVKDLAATKQNTILLLYSEKGELFGDPFYGIRLKKYQFSQNSYILRDILIDEIYTQLAVFMPQLRVDRSDIKLIRSAGKLTARFKAINQVDFTTNTYNLVLYDLDNQ